MKIISIEPSTLGCSIPPPVAVGSAVFAPNMVVIDVFGDRVRIVAVCSRGFGRIYLFLAAKWNGTVA